MQNVKSILPTFVRDLDNCLQNFLSLHTPKDLKSTLQAHGKINSVNWTIKKNIQWLGVSFCGDGQPGWMQEKGNTVTNAVGVTVPMVDSQPDRIIQNTSPRIQLLDST